MKNIGELWEAFKTKKLAREFSKHPVVNAGCQYINHHYPDDSMDDRFGAGWSKDERYQMYCRLVDIATSASPVQLNREHLVFVTHLCAKFNVLRQPEWMKSDPIRNAPGISFSLWERARQLRELDSELSALLSNYPADLDSVGVALACYQRLIRMTAWMDMHNVVRIALNDFNITIEHDWFLPLYYAQCVLQEASYWTILARTTSLLDDDLERDIDALSLKFLVDLVSNGERYPNLVWEEKFKKKLPVFDSAPTPA